MTQTPYITEAMRGIMEALEENNCLFRIERPSGHAILITILSGKNDGFRKEYSEIIDCPYWSSQVRRHAYETTLKLIEQSREQHI